MLKKIYKGEEYVQHLGGLLVTAASVVKTAAGAGAAATTSIINGDDVSGIIELVTHVADTPLANSTILTLTFGAVHSGGIPRVHIQPANAAAWALAYGIVQVIDANNTNATFLLSSGATPLPAADATYRWSYIVVGRSV